VIFLLYKASRKEQWMLRLHLVLPWLFSCHPSKKHFPLSIDDMLNVTNVGRFVLVQRELECRRFLLVSPVDVNRNFPDELAPTTTVGLCDDSIMFSDISQALFRLGTGAFACRRTRIVPETAFIRALGACGIIMGTRFIATPEARSSETYRESLVKARDEDTFVSRCYTGKTLRAICNDYILDWEKRPEDLKKFPEQILVSMNAEVLNFISDGEIHDASRQCLPAGQVTGMIHEVKPAADIVRETIEEAEKILKEHAALVS